MNRRNFAACITLVACACTSCSLFPSEEAVPPPIIQAGEFSYNTVEVARSSIAKTVTKSGSLISPRQYNLSFEKHGGYITQFIARSKMRVKEGDILASLDAESLERQVADQEIAVRIAEIDYDETLANAWQGTRQSSVKRAQAYLDLAVMRLENLRAEFDSVVIRSPIDGIITYASALRVGDFVDARQTVITVSDDTELVVLVTGSDGGDLIDMNLGLEVNIEYQREDYPGVVTVTPADAPSDAFYNNSPFVMVEFVNQPAEMTIGHSARVSFDKEFREDVVVVPSNAVTQYGSYAYVQVLEGGVRRERPVEIGLTTPTEVEIVKGLEPGELLIVR